MNLVPVFLTGLFGAAHCIGMCGGIVSAFSSASAKPFPVAVTSAGATAMPAARSAGQLLAFNAGRVLSYATAGALAGGLAQGLAHWSGVAQLQMAAYALANGMLLALGLYLMDLFSGLAHIERVGQVLWQRLRPALRFALPVDSLPKAALLGSIWGWLPCGMVYSMLLTAMFTGSAAQGAQVMLAFGLGTVPALFGAGLLGARLSAMRDARVRRAAGAIVFAFGALGIYRLLHGVGPQWLDAFCLTPGGHL